MVWWVLDLTKTFIMIQPFIMNIIIIIIIIIIIT